jgi:hypothetical protein
MTFDVSPERVLRRLGFAIVFFMLAHLALGYLSVGFGYTRVFGLLPLFSLVGENNLPTLYSSAMLLVASALSAIVARAARTGDRQYFLHWCTMAAAFAFLAYDEVAQVHEQMGNYLSVYRPSGFFRFVWVIPYGIAAAIFGIAYVPFLLRLPRRIARLVLAAGVTFVVGAIGFEMVTAKLIDARVRIKVVDVLLPSIEEGLEMAGVALFVYALLLLIRDEIGPLKITVGKT